jgi:glycosyltransferase involved in cell wall biosynthesis
VVCSPQGSEIPELGKVSFVALPVPRHRFFDKFLVDRLRFGRRAAKYLEGVLRDGDVVQVHGIEYGLHITRLLRRYPACKLIVTSHGSYFRQYTELVLRYGAPGFSMLKMIVGVWRWYAYLLERSVLRQTKILTCISADTLEYLRTTYGISQTCVALVIPNGAPDITIQKPGKAALERSQQSDVCSGQWEIVMVGSTYNLKGVDLAMSALQGLIDQGYSIRLKLVGFSEMTGRELPAWVEHVGRVSSDQVAVILRDSHMLVFPSRYESGNPPLTVLEAVVAGIPVVASEAAHYTELDPGQLAGVSVATNDASALREGLVRVMSEYGQYLQGVQQLDLSGYDWDKIVATYSSLWKSA